MERQCSAYESVSSPCTTMINKNNIIGSSLFIKEVPAGTLDNRSATHQQQQQKPHTRRERQTRFTTREEQSSLLLRLLVSASFSSSSIFSYLSRMSAILLFAIIVSFGFTNNTQPNHVAVHVQVDPANTFNVPPVEQTLFNYHQRLRRNKLQQHDEETASRTTATCSHSSFPSTSFPFCFSCPSSNASSPCWPAVGANGRLLALFSLPCSFILALSSSSTSSTISTTTTTTCTSTTNPSAPPELALSGFVSNTITIINNTININTPTTRSVSASTAPPLHHHKDDHERGSLRALLHCRKVLSSSAITTTLATSYRKMTSSSLFSSPIRFAFAIASVETATTTAASGEGDANNYHMKEWHSEERDRGEAEGWTTQLQRSIRFLERLKSNSNGAHGGEKSSNDGCGAGSLCQKGSSERNHHFSSGVSSKVGIDESGVFISTDKTNKKSKKRKYFTDAAFSPQALNRPALGSALKWAMPIEITMSFEGGYVYAGLVAAFHQHNKALASSNATPYAKTPNVDYNVDVYPLHHSIYGAIPEPFTSAFILNGDTEYFGFAGSRLLSDYFLGNFGEALSPPLPSIGNQPLESPLRFMNTQIGMRANTQAELNQLVNFAFHSTETLCTKSAVFSLGSGAALAASYLVQTGSPPPIEVVRSDISGALDYVGLFKVVGDPEVNCIFIQDVEDVATSLIKGLKDLVSAERFESMKFFIGSGGLKARYDASERHTFRNVYGAQVTPDPLSESLPLAKQFREALADPFVQNFSEAQLIYPVVRRAYTPNFATFEGYIVGRFILQILSNTGDVTRNNFIDSVYRNRFALFGGYSVGPYTRGDCVAGVNFECNCNVGLKRIYMSKLNGVTGEHEIQEDKVDKGEVDVASLGIPLEVCTDIKTILRRSLRLVYVYPTSAAAAVTLGHVASSGGGGNSSSDASNFSIAPYEQLKETLFTIVNASNKKALANRQLLAMQLVTVAFDGSEDFEASFFPRIFSRYYPYAVIGAPYVKPSLVVPSPTNSSGGGASQVAHQAVASDRVARIAPKLLTIDDTDESVRSSDLDLFASIADHIHTLISFSSSASATLDWGAPLLTDSTDNNNNSPSGGSSAHLSPSVASFAGPFSTRPVHVIATNSKLASLAVRSVHTFYQRADQPATVRQMDSELLLDGADDIHVESLVRDTLLSMLPTRLLTNSEVSRLEAALLGSPSVTTTTTTTASPNGGIAAFIDSLPASPVTILFASNSKKATAALLRLVKRLPRGVLLMIAADEAHITEGFAGDPLTRATGVDVLFASAFGPWWSGLSALSQTSDVIIKSNTSFVGDGDELLLGHNVNASLSARRVPGYLLRPQAIVESLFAVAARATNVSRSLPETLYNTASVSLEALGGLTLGRFSNTQCGSNLTSIISNDDGTVVRNPSRRCDCTKGSRRFYALSLRDWSSNVAVDGATSVPDAATLPSSSSSALSNSATRQFVFDLAGCGIEYLPLPSNRDSSALNTATIAIVASASSLAVIVFAVSMVLLTLSRLQNGATRDSRHAPKDVDEPLAVVFTDIQSSTRLWSLSENIMSQAIEEHNTIMRDCIKETNGYEVKTIGDSFMVVFKSVSDAVNFSVLSQRRLFAHEWHGVNESYEQIFAEEGLLQGQQLQRLRNDSFDNNNNEEDSQPSIHHPKTINGNNNVAAESSLRLLQYSQELANIPGFQSSVRPPQDDNEEENAPSNRDDGLLLPPYEYSPVTTFSPRNANTNSSNTINVTELQTPPSQPTCTPRLLANSSSNVNSAAYMAGGGGGPAVTTGGPIVSLASGTYHASLALPDSPPQNNQPYNNNNSSVNPLPYTASLIGNNNSMNIQKLLDDRATTIGGGVDPATDPSLWNGLRVRTGVHYGKAGKITVDPRTKALDYFGSAVNTSARVHHVGHGGMILVTQEVMAALNEQGTNKGTDKSYSTSRSPTTSPRGDKYAEKKQQEQQPPQSNSKHSGASLSTSSWELRMPNPPMRKAIAISAQQLQNTDTDIELREKHETGDVTLVRHPSALIPMMTGTSATGGPNEITGSGAAGKKREGCGFSAVSGVVVALPSTSSQDPHTVPDHSPIVARSLSKRRLSTMKVSIQDVVVENNGESSAIKGSARGGFGYASPDHSQGGSRPPTLLDKTLDGDPTGTNTSHIITSFSPILGNAVLDGGNSTRRDDHLPNTGNDQHNTSVNADGTRTTTIIVTNEEALMSMNQQQKQGGSAVPTPTSRTLEDGLPVFVSAMQQPQQGSSSTGQAFALPLSDYQNNISNKNNENKHNTGMFSSSDKHLPATDKNDNVSPAAVVEFSRPTGGGADKFQDPSTTPPLPPFLFGSRELAVFVVPLGPQALRGLEQSVELFHIILDEFAERTYPPLRLDSELANPMDEAEDTGSASDGSFSTDSAKNGEGDKKKQGSSSKKAVAAASSTTDSVSPTPTCAQTQIGTIAPSCRANNNINNNQANVVRGGGGTPTVIPADDVERSALKYAERERPRIDLVEFMANFRFANRFLSYIDKSDREKMLKTICQKKALMAISPNLGARVNKMLKSKSKKGNADETVDRLMLVHISVALSKLLGGGARGGVAIAAPALIINNNTCNDTGLVHAAAGKNNATNASSHQLPSAASGGGGVVGGHSVNVAEYASMRNLNSSQNSSRPLLNVAPAANFRRLAQSGSDSHNTNNNNNNMNNSLNPNSNYNNNNFNNRSVNRSRRVSNQSFSDSNLPAVSIVAGAGVVQSSDVSALTSSHPSKNVPGPGAASPPPAAPTSFTSGADLNTVGFSK